MRTLRPLPLLVLLLLAAVNTGCASADQSPMQRADALNETFIVTVDALTEAKGRGYLSPEDVKALTPYVDAANAARREVSRAARAGSKDEPFSDFRTAVAAFNAAFDELLRAKMKAQETKAAVQRVNVPTPEPTPIPSDPQTP